MLRCGASPLRPGRRILLGEVCPAAVAGRPGLWPLLLRGVQWSDDAAEVSEAISTPGIRFAVLGVDGKRVGVFESGELAEAASHPAVVGTFSGAGPCTKVGANGARLEEPTCQAATRGCGVAVASLGDGGELGAVATGGACTSADLLVVDLDGNGAAESYPVASLLDGVRGPAEVVEARAQVATCAPSFSLFGLRIAPPPEGKNPPDPRYVVLVDVLAVADLDDDGRRELVLGLRYPEQRTVAVFGAGEAGSLVLLGEAAASR